MKICRVQIHSKKKKKNENMNANLFSKKKTNKIFKK